MYNIHTNCAGKKNGTRNQNMLKCKEKKANLGGYESWWNDARGRNLPRKSAVWRETSKLTIGGGLAQKYIHCIYRYIYV